MRTIKAAACAALLAGAAAPALAQSEVGDMLDRFAADYMEDPTFTRDWLFGVEIGGEMWTLSLDRDTASYEIRRGTPPEPVFYFTGTPEIFERIGHGEITALTAMGRAFENDPVPFDIQLMDGAGFDPAILSFAFHFWTRGFPEILNYRELDTREIHGANGALIYYQPGFRSGFGHVAPGQHANEDPESRSNPFPTMFIVTEGRLIARIGGEDTEMEGGQLVIIPAGVDHEFLNPFGEPAYFFLFMFGEGA
ncbi:cupin domain-containing protein [Marinicauda algicola]|nr:cupin domain-containing protein [Marinicauda algicola]